MNEIMTNYEIERVIEKLIVIDIVEYGSQKYLYFNQYIEKIKFL